MAAAQEREAPMAVSFQNIVTSGDDDEDDADSCCSSLNDHHPSSSSTKAHNHGDEDHATHDLLFDERADDNDKAFVDTNLRQHNKNNTTVLSCPCCFQTVCMDCQQHETYKDIFRAMFVMGITVSWDRPLHYDETSRSLVTMETDQQQRNNGGASAVVVVPAVGEEDLTMATSSSSSGEEEQSEVYFTVRCANCTTVVAALDMRDEVYHFSGCLASS